MDGSIDRIIDNSDGINFEKEADFIDLLVYSWKLKQTLSYSFKTKNILEAINSQVITKELEQWKKQNSKSDEKQSFYSYLAQLYDGNYTDWDSFVAKFNDNA